MCGGRVIVGPYMGTQRTVLTRGIISVRWIRLTYRVGINLHVFADDNEILSGIHGQVG